LPTARYDEVEPDEAENRALLRPARYPVYVCYLIPRNERILGSGGG
jgi:hypothetical protein